MTFDPKHYELVQRMYNMNIDWDYPTIDVEESQNDIIFADLFQNLNNIRREPEKAIFNAIKSSTNLLLLAIMIILRHD